MYKVELTDYFDVWGNEIDGFEVNNLSHEVHESESDIMNYDDKQVLAWLKDIGYLKKEVTLDEIAINNCSDLIELEMLNGYPIGRIMPVY